MLLWPIKSPWKYASIDIRQHILLFKNIFFINFLNNILFKIADSSRFSRSNPFPTRGHCYTWRSCAIHFRKKMETPSGPIFKGASSHTSNRIKPNWIQNCGGSNSWLRHISQSKHNWTGFSTLYMIYTIFLSIYIIKYVIFNVL